MAYKLLLADDSVTIQKVVELTFTDEDFDIISVGDGITALEKIKAEKPDIILSDVIMPGMNGYELCAKVKEEDDLKRIPFLFLKGTFESFDEEKANAAGADGFIVKPFESQELIPKVKEMVESYRAPAYEPAEVPVEEPVSHEETVSFLDEKSYEEAAREPVSSAPADLDFDVPAIGDAEVSMDIPVDEEVTFSEEAAVPGGLLEGEVTPEEDLWSEVKITDHPIPPATPVDISDFEVAAPPEMPFPEEKVEVEEVAESVDEVEFETVTLGETVETLEEEAIIEGEPVGGEQPAGWEEPAVQEIPMGEAVFEDAPATLEPEEPEIPVEPVSPTPAAEEKIALSEAEVGEMLAAKVADILREIAPGIIKETTRQVLSEVAWEVIPDAAEKLIQKEIDRLTGRGQD